MTIFSIVLGTCAVLGLLGFLLEILPVLRQRDNPGNQLV
jgi:hypothetical protein